MTFRKRLAGWDVPDDDIVGDIAVPGHDEQDLTPETITAGTPAWQRSRAMAARKRRGGH